MPRVDSYDPDAPVPDLGSRWLWEPTRPHAYEFIVVVEVKWNGEEWWVRTRGRNGIYWGDLSRFWEAVVPETPHARAKADRLHLESRVPLWVREQLGL